MSMVALCKGVVDHLRSTGVVNSSDPLLCDLAFEGYPHPAAGEVFYAVHAGDWGVSGVEGDWDLSERMGCVVTISKKLGYAPKDRRATDAWAKVLTGLDALSRKVVVALHQNQAVRAQANTYLGATDGGFVTALLFKGATRPEIKGSDWFGTEPSASGDDVIGIAISLTFGMMERYQTIATMT